MRIRALTFALLPVEVDTDSISVPSSRIITPDVRLRVMPFACTISSQIFDPQNFRSVPYFRRSSPPMSTPRVTFRKLYVSATPT